MSFSFFRQCRSTHRGYRDCAVVEPAAERPNEVDRQRELARAQFGIEALLRKQRRLGGKDFEVVADAFAVTKEREVIRFLRRSQRLSLLHALLVDALERGK